MEERRQGERRQAHVAPFQPVIVSERGLWWRRIIAFLLVVNVFLFIASIQQTNENQAIGDGNRAILCALTVDDAQANEIVRQVYESFCGHLDEGG